MATALVIDDPADHRVLAYTGLSDPSRRRQFEHDDGSFVAEGVLVIRRLLASDYVVRSVLVTPARHDDLAADLAGRDEIDVYVATPSVMNAIAGFDIHRGAVAVGARRPQPTLADVLLASRTVAVLEAINDTENLGAMVRSASALGVDAMVLDPTCADPLYRRCLRVSMGEALFVPFTRVERWPGALTEVTAAGFRLLALTPARAATPIDQLSIPPDEKVALLLGAEGPGLSDAVLARSEPVRIAIARDVDSLNVGHAAAIAFHEIARRRC